jgi:hypothetical protein
MGKDGILKLMSQLVKKKMRSSDAKKTSRYRDNLLLVILHCNFITVPSGES